MSKIKARKKGSDAIQSGYRELSKLGEELISKFPDMVEESANFREEEQARGLMDVINGLFPFEWNKPEDFAHGIELCVGGLHKEAQGIFSELLQTQPDAYPAYHFMGYACGSMENYKGEVDNCRKALKLRPEHPHIYFSLGLAYWNLGKNNKAFESFKKGVSLAENFSIPDFWWSLTFDQLGRYPDDSQIKENVRRDKMRSLAHANYILGNAYLEYGIHPSARHAFKKAVRIKPDFARAYYQLGFMHIKKLRNPKRAVKYLEKAELLFSNQSDLQRAAQAHQLYSPKEEIQNKDKAAEEWLKEGLRLQRIGRYQGAVDACKVAVSFKADFPDAYYNMGIAYGSMDDSGLMKMQSAIGAFKQAIAIDADFIHSYIALGASYIKKSELEEALHHLDKAIELDAENLNAQFYLGTALRLSGNFDEAAEAFIKVKALDPDSVQSHYSLGLTYLDSERYQEACEAFEEVIRIKPDFADAHFMLGNLYQRPLTDFEKSLVHLKKAEKLYFKIEDHQQLARVRQLISRISD